MPEIIQKIELSDESIAKLALIISQSQSAGNLINPNYLTVREAADYIRVSQRQLRNLLYKNKIPFYRPEGKILFKKKDLDNYMEENKVESLSNIIKKAVNKKKF